MCKFTSVNEYNIHSTHLQEVNKNTNAVLKNLLHKFRYLNYDAEKRLFFRNFSDLN